MGQNVVGDDPVLVATTSTVQHEVSHRFLISDPTYVVHLVDPVDYLHPSQIPDVSPTHANVTVGSVLELDKRLLTPFSRKTGSFSFPERFL